MAAPPPVTHQDALPSGTRLHEFEIDKVVGVGGFGIVYRAIDHALQRVVALKEYLPGSLAGRGMGLQVTIRSTSHAETFGVGMRSFVNEARLLARFDHAGLLKVYRFWEDNGTAYMVMPFYDGKTLAATRRAMTHAPGEKWMRTVLEPLMGALEVMHNEQVYHRDVAPDNVILRPDGMPVLLDFGAARHVIGDRTQTLTAIIKPNFAPIEQYSESTLLKQGPWTDVYALAAVVYYCALGRPPIPASARAVVDEVVPLPEIVRDAGLDWSERFAQVWHAAMAIRPAERPQSIAQLRAMLDEAAPLPTSVRQRSAHGSASAGNYARTIAVTGPAPPLPADDPALQTVVVGKAGGLPPGGVTEALGAGLPTTMPVQRTQDRRDTARGTARRAAPAPRMPRAWAWGLIAAAPLVLAGAVWWSWPAPAAVPMDARADGVTGPVAGARGAGHDASANSPPSDATVNGASAAPVAASAAGLAALPVAVPPAVEPSGNARVSGDTDAALIVVPPKNATSPPQVAGPGDAAPPDPAGDLRVRPTAGAGPRRSAAPHPRPGYAAGTPRDVPVLVLGNPALGAPAVVRAGALAAKAGTASTNNAAPAERPRANCGGRVLVALFRCMQRQCAKPQLTDHPECVEWRRQEDGSHGPH